MSPEGRRARRQVRIAAALFALLASLSWAALAHAQTDHPFGSRLIVEAVKRLNPSVVHIRVKPREGTGDAFFGLFGRKRREETPPRFSPGQGGEAEQFNVGSGLIISADGYILTNQHVVQNAADIRVRLYDGEEYPARLAGTDEKTDLALLRIEPRKPLPPAPLGDSDKTEVGEWVLAIGSPFGLDHSVSVGVISAKGRDLGEGPFDDYLQTDASINPGNSGGPLANSRGEVIGINTAIFSEGPKAWSLGIGFAIPINQAKAVIDDLRYKGYPVRGLLGATIGQVSDAERKHLGLGHFQGARLAQIVRGGPADKAGLRRGDIVVTFGGKDITTWQTLPRLVARSRPGTEVNVKFYRGGKLETARVRLGSRPEALQTTSPGPVDSLGLRVEPLTPALSRRFKIEEGIKLLVTRVEKGGAADHGGVHLGDQIVEVNRIPVATLSEYEKLTKQALADKFVLLTLRRGGSDIFAAVQLN